MTRVILDADLRGKLLNLDQPLELCDEAGHVLPVVDPALYEDLEPQISREEMERRKLDKGTSYTTAEVLEYLETL